MDNTNIPIEIKMSRIFDLNKNFNYLYIQSSFTLYKSVNELYKDIEYVSKNKIELMNSKLVRNSINEYKDYIKYNIYLLNDITSVFIPFLNKYYIYNVDQEFNKQLLEKIKELNKNRIPVIMNY